MSDPNSYPLAWPIQVPRTPPHQIAPSQFTVTPYQAQREMMDELYRLGATDIVVSTNAALRRDGRPYAKPPRIADHAVAVYFTRKGKPQVMALDRYPTIWENMRGIGKTIESIRTIERHGSSQMVDAAFAGFAALPAETSGPSWWSVLGIAYDAPRAEIESAYRQAVRESHPDAGGDEAQFHMVNEAYRQALKVAR